MTWTPVTAMPPFALAKARVLWFRLHALVYLRLKGEGGAGNEAY